MCLDFNAKYEIKMCSTYSFNANKDHTNDSFILKTGNDNKKQECGESSFRLKSPLRKQNINSFNFFYLM